MMATSLEFFMGFMCFGLLVLLYLLHQLIQTLRDFMLLLIDDVKEV